MSIKNKLNIAVVGATGFTGLELVYLLSKHPKVKIVSLSATKKLGKKISYFDKRIKKKLPVISSINKVNWSNIDIVYLSLPNGEAQKLIKKLFYKFEHLKFIDLSADFRLKNSDTYFKNYKLKHKAKELLNHSFYAISEFSKRQLSKYRIIANPGCYPTSVQLALIPLLIKKLINLKDISIDSKSGYSGAGKGFKKRFNHKNLYSSTFAYNIKFHRHTAEIEQEFKNYLKKNTGFTFNPHLIPTYRGILSTIYINIGKKSSAKKIFKELRRFYKNSYFVKILKLNSEIGSGNVINTNNCEISVCQTKFRNKIIIFSAIDNLIKGASGQAIQNMNIMNNFSETLGLK